ncbi:hypothetical protein DXG01_014628 [Tephrocybe rancida]|nr:hypothetical protein DXG01_014628 [Tephrocybe rancida]
MKLCIPKRHLKRGRPPTPSYTPIAGPPHARVDILATGKLPSLIFVMHGQTLVQNQYLPRNRKGACPAALQAVLDDENPFLDDGGVHTVDPALSRHRQKREAQWARWQGEVIPRIIAPFMEYMCASKSMRELPTLCPQTCTCGEVGCTIEVLVVHFNWLLAKAVRECADMV